MAALRALVDQMVRVIALEAGTTWVQLGSRILVHGLGLSLVSSWEEATPALRAKVSVSIARGANSAWRGGWVMVVAGKAFRVWPDIWSFGRFKVLGRSMRGLKRRVLR